jgi:hypothetical protein
VKKISSTYSGGGCLCFCSIIIQHARRMRHITLSSVDRLALPYLSILSHKRNDFRGKKSLNTKCVFCCSLQLLSETFLIIRIKSANYCHKSPESSVGIATRYRLDCPGIESRWETRFSATRPDRHWGTHPASCILGTGSLLRGVKRPVSWRWPPHTIFSADVLNCVELYRYVP